MGWADHYIFELQALRTVRFRPRGNSMTGKIESGQRVTVEAVTHPREVSVGDVVLCKVRGAQYLHLVVAKKLQPDGAGGVRTSFLIGNNKGKTNGWTPADKVYGRVVLIEP